MPILATQPIQIEPINPDWSDGSLTVEQALDDPVNYAMKAVTPVAGAFGVFVTAILGIKLVQYLIASLQK